MKLKFLSKKGTALGLAVALAVGSFAVSAQELSKTGYDYSAAALKGAGNDGGTNQSNQGITVTPNTLSLKVKETKKLTVASKNEGESVQDGEVKWSSSNDKVATVNAGTVTGVAAGTATIKAEYKGAKATCEVTVTAVQSQQTPTTPKPDTKPDNSKQPPKTTTVEVTGVTVDKEAVLTKGATKQLTATVAPANATDKTVTWKSSDAKIATVDAKGLVKGVKGGTATITATTKNGKSATCKVTVATITLNAKSVPLQVKKSTTAIKVATKTYSKDKIASVKSSKKSVATAKLTKGKIKVTGKKAGSAKITVTMKSGAKATCTVKVQKKAVKTKSLKIQKSGKTIKKLTLKKGKKATVAVVRNPITATEKITWKSSNKKIATVTNSGKITAKKAGKVKITAKSKNGKKVTITVTVKK